MRLATQLKEFLETDSAITALLPGKIWDRPLVMPEVLPDGNPLNDDEYIYVATPEAFMAPPDGPFGQTRRCVSIIVPERIETLLNWRDMQYDSPELYFYCPNIEEEIDLALAAVDLIRQKLTSRFLNTSTGGFVVNPLNTGYEFRPSPELIWSVSKLERFEVAWFTR